VLAAVLNQIGDTKLELRDDVTTVALGPHEVRVRVKATGVCHSDLSAMDGTLPALAPGVLGHEGAGEVAEVGSAVTHLAPGDRVIVSFIPPCGQCNFCLGGQPNLCMVHPMEAFSSPRFLIGDVPAFGMAGCGTFAEELVLPSVGAVKFADDVPYEVAALISCGLQTGVGAVLNTAKVEPVATAVVLGCGGVGVAVIQGLRIAGATVIVAVDPLEEKHEGALAFGATHAVTPEGLAALSATLTGGLGFDYAFDVVGRSGTIRSAYDNARRGGTAVVVGAGRADDQVQFSAQELFVMERRLLGSFYGSGDVRRDFAKLIGFWRSGQLTLDAMITRRLRLPEINDALDALRGGGAHQIRQVVTFD
jgi:S-(hydroxymethyl)glutathione dehydrogenase/alcohol dehydrogenase